MHLDIMKIHFTSGLTAMKQTWAPLRKSKFLTTHDQLGIYITRNITHLKYPQIKPKTCPK